MWDNRQQACPFPADVVSLVFGEVKHIVHLIRWNLIAVLCQLGQDLTACLEWLNARPLGLGTESCLWKLLHRFLFSLHLSNVPVDNSSDVMAYSAAAFTCFFDVATINAECTFIWTSFAIASYMVFVLFANVACLSHTIFVIRIIDHSSSCGTISPPRAYNDHTHGSWNHHGAHRSTGFHYSHGTHRSNYMASCSSSIAYIDYSTDTTAELSVPTSHSSPSTIDWSIHVSSWWTSTTCSQGRPKASLWQETWQTTPFSSKSFTSCYTTGTNDNIVSAHLARTCSAGFHYTTTCWIGSSNPSSTIDDPGLPTRSRTTSTTSPPRCTYNWPHTAHTITYIGTTHNHAATCTENETHWTWSSGPWHRLCSSCSSSSLSTCSNIAITPTTIQDPTITLPSTFHTTASSSTFPSPCCSTSLSPSSISVFDKTRQGSPNTFSIQKKITAKTTLSSGSSTSSISSPTTLQNSSSSLPRPRSRITTSYTSIQSKFHPHTWCWWHLGRMEQQPLPWRPPSRHRSTQISRRTTTTWTIHKPTNTPNSTTWSRGLPCPWRWQRKLRCSRSIFHLKIRQEWHRTQRTCWGGQWSTSCTMPDRARPKLYSTPPYIIESIQQASLQSLRWRNVQSVGSTISYRQQPTYFHQSKPSHRQEYCQGLCTIQITWHRSGKANQSILCRAREPADHHGSNGVAQETDLSWRTRGHLPDLPQNELGNSCQDPCWRLHSPGNLDKKRGRLPDSIPMLRVLRHVLWDSWHRWPTRLCRQAMYLPALPHRERTKPIWPIGHLSLSQMHAGPIWRKWPNSMLVQPTGHLQGQRQCNGYELQCCINMLRCLYSFCFPRIDHTLGSGNEPTHSRSTQWTFGQPPSWSWTSSTTRSYRWYTCIFRSTTRRLSSDNQPSRDHRTYRTRSCSPTLEWQPLVGQFNIYPSRSPFILSWRPLSRSTSRRPSSIPHFGIQPLQISLVSTSSLRSTWQTDDSSTTAIQWA